VSCRGDTVDIIYFGATPVWVDRARRKERRKEEMFNQETSSSSIYSLPHKARCLAAQVARDDRSRFLAGTLSLKEENEVWSFVVFHACSVRSHASLLLSRSADLFVGSAGGRRDSTNRHLLSSIRDLGTLSISNRFLLYHCIL